MDAWQSEMLTDSPLSTRPEADLLLYSLLGRATKAAASRSFLSPKLLSSPRDCAFLGAPELCPGSLRARGTELRQRPRCRLNRDESASSYCLCA